MRSYIFTARERKIIKAFLDAKIGITDPSLWQIRSRIKSFITLENDIKAYLRLREAESAITT